MRIYSNFKFQINQIMLARCEQVYQNNTPAHPHTPTHPGGAKPSFLVAAMMLLHAMLGSSSILGAGRSTPARPRSHEH